MKLFSDKADLRDLDTAAALLIEYVQRGHDLARTLLSDLNAIPDLAEALQKILSEFEPVLADMNSDARSIMTAEELEGMDACRGNYADNSLDTSWIRDRLRKAAKAEALEALHSRHLWSLVSDERWFDLPVADSDSHNPF